MPTPDSSHHLPLPVEKLTSASSRRPTREHFSCGLRLRCCSCSQWQTIASHHCPPEFNTRSSPQILVPKSWPSALLSIHTLTADCPICGALVWHDLRVHDTVRCLKGEPLTILPHFFHLTIMPALCAPRNSNRSRSSKGCVQSGGLHPSCPSRWSTRVSNVAPSEAIRNKIHPLVMPPKAPLARYTYRCDSRLHWSTYYAACTRTPAVESPLPINCRCIHNNEQQLPITHNHKPTVC
jgi:hypothetical protein